MKSAKIAGIRLINYINDGINWKDHKDLVLDFWVYNKCRDFGYNPKQFHNMFYVNELPTEIQDVYETWFGEFDFTTTEDADWIEFVNGTLNIFYHTSDPTLLSDDTWFVITMKSEIKAREICESQIFHGNPNVNTFWKIDTNSKSEEVSGRRNGYLFSNQLENVSNADTRGFYWGVAFQCPDSVKLSYIDETVRKSRCINWAADCKNMTLLKVTDSGRFTVLPILIEGGAWKEDRLIPAKKDIRSQAFTGHALMQYLTRFYDELYGEWEKNEEMIKQQREMINQRKNATNTMNDEEVNISKLVNVEEFILSGNVDDFTRVTNQTIRKRIKDRNKIREREIKKRMREIDKNKGKVDRRSRNQLNPFLSNK